jgi:hypothetical protein
MKLFSGLVALGVLGATPSLAQAQAADVTVSATVSSMHNMEAVKPTLELGTGAPGALLTIAPNAGGAGIAKASFNAASTISFAEVTKPTGPGGALDLTYSCSYDDNATNANYDAGADATGDASGNMAGPNCNVPKTFNVAALALERWFFVGASITLPNVVAGDYIGTVRFTIAP